MLVRTRGEFEPSNCSEVAPRTSSQHSSGLVLYRYLKRLAHRSLSFTGRSIKAATRSRFAFFSFSLVSELMVSLVSLVSELMVREQRLVPVHIADDLVSGLRAWTQDPPAALSSLLSCSSLWLDFCKSFADRMQVAGGQVGRMQVAGGRTFATRMLVVSDQDHRSLIAGGQPIAGCWLVVQQKRIVQTRSLEWISRVGHRFRLTQRA